MILGSKHNNEQAVHFYLTRKGGNYLNNFPSEARSLETVRVCFRRSQKHPQSHRQKHCCPTGFPIVKILIVNHLANHFGLSLGLGNYTVELGYGQGQRQGQGQGQGQRHQNKSENSRSRPPKMSNFFEIKRKSN